MNKPEMQKRFRYANPYYLTIGQPLLHFIAHSQFNFCTICDYRELLIVVFIEMFLAFNYFRCRMNMFRKNNGQRMIFFQQFCSGYQGIKYIPPEILKTAISPVISGMDLSSSNSSSDGIFLKVSMYS